MNFDEYQHSTEETAKQFHSIDDALACWALCLCGEAGELANVTKKVLWHGHPLEVDRFIDEMGDVLWYLTALASALGVPMDVVAQRNLDKLRKRYPNGYSDKASINRIE